jgi:ankyrin repeat domain-containing protein 50
MADPLSVTASVAGIVSLGYPILTQGIKFCAAFEDAPKEIFRLKARFEGLNGLLDALERTLKSVEEQSQIFGIEEDLPKFEKILTQTKVSLNHLNQQIQKLTELIPSPDRKRDKIRNAWARLEYAVKKDSLANLEKETSGLHQNLNSLMQLCFYKSLQETTSEIRDKMLTTEHYEHNEMLKWMSEFSHSRENHAEIQKLRTKGTGQWVFGTSEWDRWHKERNSVLWLHGASGVGKTVLCSTIIDHLGQVSASPNSSFCAYHYFSFAREQQQKLEFCLMSMIYQLCHLRGAFPPDLHKAWEKSRPNAPDIDVLTDILKKFVQSSTKTFLIFDALDECPEIGTRDIFLNWLQELHDESMGQLSVLVTSGSHKDIEDTLITEIAGQSLAPDQSKIRGDISRYVDAEISDNRKLAKLARRDKQLAEKVKDRLSIKAEGMFRWAYCQLQSLKRLPIITAADVDDMLSNLPEDLHQHYERILAAIHTRYQPVVRRALLWLLTSRRPLTPDELAEACVVHLEPSSATIVDQSRKFDPDDIYELMPDLILAEDIGSETTIRLAHFSVQEYLVSGGILSSKVKDFHINLLDAEISVGRSCLRYISDSSLKWGPRPSHELDDGFPLMRYACRCWHLHLNGIADAILTASGIETLVLELLTTREKFQAWLMVHSPDGYYIEDGGSGNDGNGRKYGSPIYFAAFLGLHTCLDHLFKKGHDVNAQGGTFGTALQAAVAGRQVTVFDHLLNLGADPHIQGGMYGNVLGACAAKGLRKYVTRLLKEGVDPRASDSVALHRACEAGQAGIAQELLDAGARVQDAVGLGTPLMYAAFENHCAVIEVLLMNEADVNQVVSGEPTVDEPNGRHFVCAVQAAATEKSLDALKLLINSGANVNTLGGLYDSPLSVAARTDSHGAMRLLLANDADPNLRSHQDVKSPLYEAIFGGHVEVAETLIHAGARLETMDEAEMENEIAEADGAGEWVTKQCPLLNPKIFGPL